jgi:hypothetical protein
MKLLNMLAAILLLTATCAAIENILPTENIWINAKENNALDISSSGGKTLDIWTLPEKTPGKISVSLLCKIFDFEPGEKMTFGSKEVGNLTTDYTIWKLGNITTEEVVVIHNASRYDEEFKAGNSGTMISSFTVK